MKGYHATLKMNGLSIIKDELIKLTNENNSIYGVGEGVHKTTEGYIYLATNIEKALEFGLMAWGRKYNENKSIEKEIYIFKIVLGEDIKMYIDEDQLNLEDMDIKQNNIKLINDTQSFRIDKELRLGREILKYTIIEFTDMNEGYDIVDSHFSNTDIEWIKLD